MPQEKVKRIHLIYGCISAVLIIALGIALILSCLDIYNSGPRPYSAEAISLRFRHIAILVYACILVVVGGIILGLVLPVDNQRPKAKRDAMVAMNKLRARLSVLDDETTKAVRKEQKLRLGSRIGTAGIVTLLMIYPAIYFMDSSHFTIVSVNTDIRTAVCIALLPAAVGLALCFVCSLLLSKSIDRETAVYKKALANTKSVAVHSEQANKSHTAMVITRSILLVIAVCFIIVGILNGGMKDVLDKAVAICTECIGLG